MHNNPFRARVLRSTKQMIKMRGEMQRLEAENARLREKADRLANAVKRYELGHSADCEHADYACTCGYDHMMHALRQYQEENDDTGTN